MSESKEKPVAAAGGGKPSIVGLLLPAVLAAAAAFGGARIAGAHHAAPTAEHVEVQTKPPGPTLALDPFLLSVSDANKKAHPMKVTIAIEFESGAKEEKEDALKSLTPRIRDAVLGYLRTQTYEASIDPSSGDKMRTELVERLRASGAPTAEHVLITDLVIQ
jgi:flagellar basal body-associated protein FliL